MARGNVQKHDVFVYGAVGFCGWPVVARREMAGEAIATLALEGITKALIWGCHK